MLNIQNVDVICTSVSFSFNLDLLGRYSTYVKNLKNLICCEKLRIEVTLGQNMVRFIYLGTRKGKSYIQDQN